MSDQTRQHYITTDGLPPGRVAPPPTRPRAAPHQHFVTKDGLVPNRGAPPPSMSTAPTRMFYYPQLPVFWLPRTSTESSPAPRMPFVVDDGRVSNDEVPPPYWQPGLSSKPSAEDIFTNYFRTEPPSDCPGSSTRYVTKDGRPPNGGAPPGASTASPPMRYVTKGGRPPNGGVPPGVWRAPCWSSCWPGHILMTPTSPPSPPVYTPRTPPCPPSLVERPNEPPPSSRLGDACFSNLPNKASGFLHPQDGYCTFALLPKGVGTHGEDFPLYAAGNITKYLGHPETTIGDPIGGLYAGEDEQLARDIGIFEYNLVNGSLNMLRRFRLGDCEGNKRCKDVEWDGKRGVENPVYLAWGRD